MSLNTCVKCNKEAMHTTASVIKVTWNKVQLTELRLVFSLQFIAVLLHKNVFILSLP